MSTLPLDLQRRLEQRWAARFRRPVPPAVLGPRFEKQDKPRATPTKGKSKTPLVGLKTAPAV